MNIGIYINADSVAHIGGSHTYMESLIGSMENCQHAKEHNIFYIYRSAKDIRLDTKYKFLNVVNYRAKKNLFSKVINFIYSLVFRKPMFRYTEDYSMSQLVNKNEIDLIWFTYSIRYVNLPCRYVFTVWDLGHKVIPQFPEVIENGQLELRESIYSYMLPRAEAIITGNAAGKEQINEHYGIDKKKIHEIEFFTPEGALGSYQEDDISPSLKQIVEQEKYLFYPAQFWAHKNHAIILKALNYLREKDNKHLNVIFSGSDKGELQRIKNLTSTLGLDDVVNFVGFVSEKELLYLYDNAFALVFPSFLGPDNLPPYEAMARKCPALLSDIPGHREQCDNYALYFDPKDESSLAERIMLLFKNEKKIEELKMKAYNFAMKNTVDNYIDKIFNVILSKGQN